MGREHLTPLRERNSEVSSGVARAVERALEVRPDDRYQTMAEFAAALRTASTASRPTLVRALPFVDAQPPASPPPARTTVAPPKSEPARRPSAPERRKAWPLLLVAILGVLALFGAFALVPAVAGLFGGSGTPSEASSPVARPSPTLAEALIVPTLPPTTPPDSTDTAVAVAPTAGATPVGGGIGQLAFASTREGVSQIFVVNFDGSDPTRLTDLADGACQPAWSAEESARSGLRPELAMAER